MCTRNLDQDNSNQQNYFLVEKKDTHMCYGGGDKVARCSETESNREILSLNTTS
jgi:hypothetical protein